MTDASALPVKAINGSDLSHAALASAYSAARLHDHHFHAPVQHAEGNVEDESISCICGFADDDGWTVACDKCNTWQHQSCYYPQYDEISLPDDMEHLCVDCKYRELDVNRARQRQQEKRGHPQSLSNGIKRTAPKSHKKKVKEPTGVYTNGWPLDKVRHDRNSASPRDQPPPAKRPKTAHRTSDSTSNTTTSTTKGHSRKRNVSNVNHRRSLSRSPDSPIDLYSEEFLHCYQEDEWSITEANLHNSIGVTNALADWIDLNDEEFLAQFSAVRGEVLQRWDGVVDDIPGKAQIEVLEHQDTSVRYNGQHPTWKAITVNEFVADGGYIGELKGHVDFKKNYQDEDANRWARLRHPEPFVFFHSKLPLVIDARHEGTEMRYVRRSCKPNARLQVLVTNGKDYHFCFMATKQIEPGEEIAVGWDTSDGLPELKEKRVLTEDALENLSGWVSTALANCGPCACLKPDDCMMSRFDRRARGQENKLPKSKKRKAGQHISPLNTQVNSRSGSEARKVDPDDDGTDSRSASGSAGQGSASRDMTPNTHYSTNGISSAIPELSERERKKLAKEEEIFRRQEEEQGKQAKKKRNSAGSSLSTPSATTSKQLGFPPNHTSNKYVDAGNSKQSGLPTKGVPGRKPKMSKSTSKPVSRPVARTKPVYVDASTQCDIEEEEEARRLPPPPSARKPFMSKQRRLLELCARNNRALAEKQQRFRDAASQPAPMDVDTSAPVPIEAAPVPVSGMGSPPPKAHEDVEMEDAPADEVEPLPSAGDNEKASSEDAIDESKSTASIEHPDPPWPPKSSADHEAPTADSQKPANMHLQMPPPTANPFLGPSSALSPSSTVVQSPATVAPGPLFSPAVTAAVNPSPARKKLSLSDYTRRKAKTHDHEPKTDRESSPASVASGPIVPPLQPSSSAEAQAAEGGSAIEEDVKMEDATPEPTKA